MSERKVRGDEEKPPGLTAHPDGASATDNAHRSPQHAVKHGARREFDGWAHTYDRSIVQHLLFQPSYRMFMEELYRWRSPLPESFDLLDIGCGTGTWTAMVAGSCLPAGRIVGLDYSLPMCGVAHRKAVEVGVNAPTFLNGDAEHLPFADRVFDAVTCSNSFHHYPHQATAVAEMHRILKPGGRLMIIDGFRDNAIGWFVFDVLITRGESTPGAEVHHASWSMMRRYYEEAGFCDVRQRKENIWAPIFITTGTA